MNNSESSPSAQFDAPHMLERDLRGHARVLQRLAQGASLDEVLHTLIDVAEDSRPEMIGSILLLDEETGRLRHGASRRLPKFYRDGIDGTMPGPDVGSCGRAACTGQRVIVEDIRSDPLWENIRELAGKAHLRACWSEPIIGAQGNVLGTFAMYYQVPRAPSQGELEFVSSSANLAALAVERVRYQNAVEGERAMLKTIVNSIPEALVAGKLDHRITHFNRGATRIFGYEPDEVYGRTTTFLYSSPEECERLARERFNTSLGDIFEPTEGLWRRKSGETFPGELVGAIVRDDDGNPIGFLGLIRDITDRKLAEARLAESRKRLVQAERLAAMGQMVSAIAHESRNALQRIQVGVDVLQYEIDPDSEARADLDRISRAKDDLERLHEDLRSVAGPIRLSVSLRNVADAWRQAWSNLLILHEDRDALLDEDLADIDPLCTFDAFRIEQVFRNLFENSLAACSDPVRITVSCRHVDADGRPCLAITVRDNGPGIPHEVREQVFEVFYTTKAKGTGLGMAIAKRFVEAHEGTIDLSAKSHNGAGFVITLPRKSE